MLAWLFHVAKKRPNFLVGGIAENFGQAYGLGAARNSFSRRRVRFRLLGQSGEVFSLSSDDLIITSLEFDHADISPISTRTSSHSAASSTLCRAVVALSVGRSRSWRSSRETPRKGFLPGHSLRLSSGQRLGCRQRPIRWRRHDFFK